MTIKYKRNEDKILKKIKDYVDSTYSAHYAKGDNRDVIDDWDAAGISKAAFQSNVIKYVGRFGKKEGENPKDIMKVIHYSMLLLNELEQEQKGK